MAPYAATSWYGEPSGERIAAIAAGDSDFSHAVAEVILTNRGDATCLRV